MSRSPSPTLGAARADRCCLARGGAEDTLEGVNGYTFDGVLLQENRVVAEAYHVNGVPSAVMIDPGGAIPSPVAIGQVAIEELLGALPALPVHVAGAVG